MPLNGFSVGRDITLSVQTSNGPVKFKKIVGFTSKMDTTDQKVKGLDGTVTNLRFPEGWSGSFEIERQDSTVDDYFAQVESDYYAGLNEQGAQITETISEVDGSSSQYQYTGVMMKADDLGEYKGDKSVNQKVAFMSSRRLKL